MSNMTSEGPASEERGAALPPEVELLLCCGRLHLDSARRERIAFLLGGQLDWRRLLELAAVHCLLPLLFFRTCANCMLVLKLRSNKRLKTRTTC